MHLNLYFTLVVATLVVSTGVLAQGRTGKAAEAVEKVGGLVTRDGSQNGKISFLDTQEKAKVEAPLGKIIKDYQAHHAINITYEKSKKDTPQMHLAKSKSDFAVILIDSPSEPAMLIAPENKWAVVNVARYGKSGDSEYQYGVRCAKAALKAFMILCSGGGSRFQGHVAAARSLGELDSAHDKVPVDMQQGINNYLTGFGITPVRRATYKKACEEGWAPQPTNDIQKAIWEKVHAPPEKPLRISYDKDKQKPVVK